MNLNKRNFFAALCICGVLSVFRLPAQSKASFPQQIKAAATCDFVNLSTVCPDIILDIRYATNDNFLGFAVYPQAACFLHKDVADAIKEVQEELALLNFGLKVFDGYRPLSVQQAMWDAIPDERYVANPAVNKGRHTRGTAINVTLVDQNGNELEMPTPFDEFSENAHSNCPYVTDAAKIAREFLRDVMERHHFKQLDTEWWHFDFEGWLDDVKFPPQDVAFDEIE